MSDRKPEVDLRKGAPRNPTEEEKRLWAARTAQVGSRSVTANRLNVNLPPDMHGEWVDAMDVGKVHEYELMGFKIDDEFAINQALHSDGAGNPRIGDVVFMTIPKWQKANIDRAFAEQAKKNNSPNRENNELAGVLDKADVPVLDQTGNVESVVGLENIGSSN